ncbi:MAG TPA: SAM-dependent methyltransferase, partial [Accumulibacter sp.]|nr:SAM-dependent methyltransferase [Accumulibacter sp.]
GYYAGGARKFGAAGDFVTAPELCAAFGQTLARQAAQILSLSAPRVIEVGAGSGQLAVDVLLELESLQALPESYAILELSGELRERQARTIAARAPQMVPRVRWLDRLPETFDGLLLANEVLDAMPACLVGWRAADVVERGVGLNGDEFLWCERPAVGALRQRALALAEECVITPGYRSEIGLAAMAWVSEWAARLGRGALLLIDYGFPRHEYYHPQRDGGTLMCHYRHHAHEQPFYLPGLQDITAHVDFTAIIESGSAGGLALLGYTSQAAFLFNCGLTEVLARTPADQPLRYLPLASAAQKLVSPAEMGELFKVMALGKGIDQPLIGFISGDRSMTL